MAGFETVVRPVVFPNIRPASTRSLPPQDDPEKGFAVIRGNAAKAMTLTSSYSLNASSANSRETKREVDDARVYQEEEDGTINRDNFVDLQVAKKIWNEGAARDGASSTMSPTEKQQNIRRGRFNERWIERYKQQEEKPNIEILNRAQIIENTDPESGP